MAIVAIGPIKVGLSLFSGVAKDLLSERVLPTTKRHGTLKLLSTVQGLIGSLPSALWTHWEYTEAI